ncbi:GlxA family transcriptional regulator [Roseovarius sp. 2305UL8-3]|uniref:GlxA family transcriptional regulator n=1 Tax=Roseovarius conchicola TaxID=3121636 RepID=UPI0035271AB1
MPKWTNPSPTTTRIAVLLFDQFSNLCLANCIEPLRAANTLGGRALFDWTLLTSDGAAVASSSGMQVLPHATLASLTSCDYLFVLASYAHDGHDTPKTRRALRLAAAEAGVVVGMDAAPWLLASAGLLNGRRATVHWDLLDAFTERFLEVEAERARVVHDQRFLTCAGAMSALDLTLGLIAERAGLAVRLDVEALFMQGDPPVNAPQERGAVTDPLVRRGLALMRENLEKPLNLKALSQVLSCQPRTLDRRFRSRLGAPPGTVYRHLRLSAARKLLEGSTLSVAEVALRSGYESPAALTRAICRQYGLPPSSLRHG